MAKNIKGILKEITQIPDWSLVQRILIDNTSTKWQNPLLVLKAVNNWCEAYSSKVRYTAVNIMRSDFMKQDRDDKIRNMFYKLFSHTTVPFHIKNEIQAQFPFIDRVNEYTYSWTDKETILVKEGEKKQLELFIDPRK